MSLHFMSKAFRTISVHGNLLKYSTTRLNGCGCSKSFLSSKASTIFTQEGDPETGEPKKKKTSIIPKITLIHGDELSVSTLEEAQKLSKRRDLKLVKLVDLDSKSQRPLYKLMTGSEYFAEDLKQRELKKQERQLGLKGEKVLIIGQHISEHDLQTHINKVRKWIEKSYEVRVVINGQSSNMQKAESIFNLMEQSLGLEGRFSQKRQKGSDIKFQILPPKKDKNDNL